jgi:chromosome segregation ATPase
MFIQPGFCRRGRARAALAGAALLALGAASAPAQDDGGAARLRLAALAEEGDLLLEEMAGLEPLRQKDRGEAERLAANEKKLTAEVARMEKDLAAYNRAVEELTATAAEYAQACPGNASAAAAAGCNDRGARLMDRAAELDTRRTALDAQQRDVNDRVTEHNQARAAWMAARRENAPRIDANAADTQKWVATARGFLATSDFAALHRRAGEPAACAGLRIADAGAHFGEQGLKRLHACVKAVLRAL